MTFNASEMVEKVVSSFFPYKTDIFNENEENKTIHRKFLELIYKLNISLRHFKLPEAVKCVYNPTEYAKQTFELYVTKYCNTKKHIMFFGMNPGPWGMSQTGVPFGEISSVRDWLQIAGPVGRPPVEIKERPVQGFECKRTEISGKRFWGFIKNMCSTPDKFFATSFVYNYLNQQWMKSNGCNLTPGDFKISEMKQLYNICDPIFIDVVKLYEVKIIVAIGKFCETRARKAMNEYLPNSNIEIYYLPHPSPRTVNNNDWEQKAMDFIINCNLLQYYI